MRTRHLLAAGLLAAGRASQAATPGADAPDPSTLDGAAAHPAAANH